MNSWKEGKMFNCRRFKISLLKRETWTETQSSSFCKAWGVNLGRKIFPDQKWSLITRLGKWKRGTFTIDLLVVSAVNVMTMKRSLKNWKTIRRNAIYHCLHNITDKARLWRVIIPSGQTIAWWFSINDLELVFSENLWVKMTKGARPGLIMWLEPIGREKAYLCK